jgi:hypothetical protein
MEAMTQEEMRNLNGGNVVCTAAAIGFTATEIGLAAAIPTGGWGLVLASVGMGASLLGMMYGCAG